MPNCPLTLRTVKGSKLTFNELDNNFVSLQNCINIVENNLNSLVNNTLNNRWHVPAGTTVTVNDGFQSFVYGDLYVEGLIELNGDSQLVVLNGDVILSGGTISGTGVTYIIEVPEYDSYVTGGTYNNFTQSIDFVGNIGFPSFSVDVSALSNDITVVSGVYDNTTGTATFTNNTGGTFTVTGFLTGYTNYYTTGATLNGNVIEFDRTDLSNAYSVDLTPALSAFSTTDYYTTGATLNGNIVEFNRNDLSNAYSVDLSSLKFTGNTISECIPDIYVTNVHSCSPLYINPNDEGDIYFGSTNTLNVDLSNSRIGIGTPSPQEKLDVFGNVRINGSLSATTISGVTFYGDGSNLTGVVSGNGSVNFIPKWNNTSRLTNSPISINTVNYVAPSVFSAITLTGIQPQGSEIDPVNNRLYVCEANQNRVRVIDLSNYTTITTIVVGSVPSSIAFDPVNNRMYVCNYSSGNVSVISTATNTVITTISVSGVPGNIAFDPINNRMYVTKVTNSDVNVISTATNTVIATISSAGSADIVFNPYNNNIYATRPNSNQINIINTTSNTIVGTIPNRADNIVYDNYNNTLWATNSATNVIYEINTFNNTIVNTVSAATNSSIHNLIYDPLNYNLYVTTLLNPSNPLFVINTISKTITNTLTVGNYATYGVYNSLDNRVYISDATSNSIFIINNGNLAYDNFRFSGNTIVGGDVTAKNLNITNGRQSIFSGNSPVELVKIIQTGDGDAFVVEDSGNLDSTHFVINSSGNTGIGLLAPSEKLHVSGNTRVDGRLITQNIQITSGATQGYVLVDNDGLGNGSWRSINRIGTKNWISALSTVDQTLSVAGTTLKMSADTSTSSGIILSAGTRFVVSTPGVYNIQFSAQLEKNSGAKPFIAVWLMKNGLNVTSSNTEVTIQGGNNERVVAAWNWLDQALSVNDYYEIAWTSDSTDVFLSHVLSPTYGPEIPSVIVTITQL